MLFSHAVTNKAKGPGTKRSGAKLEQNRLQSRMNDALRRQYRLFYASRDYGCKKIIWDEGPRGGSNSHVLFWRGESPQDGTTDYMIYGGRQPDRKPCFSLSISPDHTSTLTTLERGSDCFIHAPESSKGLVRAAYHLAAYNGATSMTLSDRSSLRCPYRISLPDLSFLTTGKTWYESILPTLRLVPTENKVRFESMRSKVQMNTWDSVSNRCNNLPPLDISDIDTSAPGSAMAVLNRAKKSGRYCQYFSENMTNLLACSGIESVYDMVWICDIPLTERRRTRKRQTTQAFKSTT